MKPGDMVTPILAGDSTSYSLHAEPDPNRVGRDRTGSFASGSFGVVLEVDRSEALVSCSGGIGWIWKGNIQVIA